MKSTEELEVMKAQYRKDLETLSQRIQQARQILAQAETASVQIAARLTLLEEIEPTPKKENANES